MSQHRYVTRYTQIARLRVAEHHRALELVRQEALLAVWPNMASTREKTRPDGAELGRSAKTMRAVPQCEPTSGCSQDGGVVVFPPLKEASGVLLNRRRVEARTRCPNEEDGDEVHHEEDGCAHQPHISGHLSRNEAAMRMRG